MGEDKDTGKNAGDQATPPPAGPETNPANPNRPPEPERHDEGQQAG